MLLTERAREVGQWLKARTNHYNNTETTAQRGYESMLDYYNKVSPQFSEPLIA
jgi:hypothetical protein